MAFEALVLGLRELHSEAPKGEKVTAIHLFGIRYSAELSTFTMSDLSKIAENAGLSPKYGTEIRKMVRLSRYVEEKIK
ncbi:hypothetical protein MED193_04306 [Roseobacter sp. MED193]|uniref:HTH-like domain-containing protein n=1 Tax=Roseobacter sp. MED193 TaxID=314262 RepID=UPI000068AD19|nr:hypothetical protein [Roseobacter sp. MED193]EAQ45021.1 hypothetical protein MED193_04306 [Roseobacter sp. MED193]